MEMNNLNKRIFKKIRRAALLAALSLLMLTGCGADKDDNGNKQGVENTTTVEPSAEAISPTQTPTPEPTSTPVPTPTPRPAYGVTELSLYKNYRDEGARKLVEGSFESEWVKGQDISSFEAIASTEQTISTGGRYFHDLWRSYWTGFENHEDCKIGYHVSFDLKTGENISKTILVPADVEGYKNYIENYLYDDINQVPGQWYSHLLDSEVDEETVVSSIKFTAGQDIDQVGDTITLTAFVYYSDEDFDSEGNYIGDVSYTITIKNTAGQ